MYRLVFNLVFFLSAIIMLTAPAAYAYRYENPYLWIVSVIGMIMFFNATFITRKLLKIKK